MYDAGAPRDALVEHLLQCDVRHGGHDLEQRLQRLPRRRDGGGVLLGGRRTRRGSARPPARSGAPAGTNGAGGATTQAIPGLTVRPSPSATSRAARSACAARSCSTNSIANCTIGPTSWSRNSNSVTTPKLPPPPRSAQNRSGCSVALARTRRPSASTTSRRFEVVDREPVQPAEPAPSTAEGQPADARVADRAGRDGEAVLLGGGVELTEGGAAADAGAAGRPGRRRRGRSG